MLNPDSPCALQHLINNWSSQAQVHGLSTLSQFVALQLPRFQDNGHRVNGLVTGPWQVFLPLLLRTSALPSMDTLYHAFSNDP